MTQPFGVGVPDGGVRPVATGDVAAATSTAAKAIGKAIGSVKPDPIAGVIASAANAATPFAGAIDAVIAVRAWTADRHNWARVAWFGSGMILFIVGAAMVAGPGTVTAALPAGKAVKLAAGALK